MDWTNYATACVHYMKKSNDLKPMSPDDFEKQLQRQPLRPVPADWCTDILKAAHVASPAPSYQPSAPNYHLSCGPALKPGPVWLRCGW